MAKKSNDSKAQQLQQQQNQALEAEFSSEVAPKKKNKRSNS
jgi:hypothetical protein